MAVISDFTLTAIATDVKAMDPLGYYLGSILTYIDTNNHVRVMHSSNNGVTWAPLGDGYVNTSGPGSPVTAKGCLITSAATFNQITIMTWIDGSASEMLYIGSGEWIPYSDSFIVGLTTTSRCLNLGLGNGWYIEGSDHIGQTYRYSNCSDVQPFTYNGHSYTSIVWGDIEPGGSANSHRIIQQLKHGNFVVTTSSDPSSGETGESLAGIRVFYTPPNPSHVPPISGFTTINISNIPSTDWVGFGDSTHFYDGILSYPSGIGGVSSGAHQFHVGQSGVNYGSHAVFSSDGVDGPQIADRGLRHPHQVALAFQVDGKDFCFFVDAFGQLGSTYPGTSTLQPDSSGISSTFGRAKSYGTAGSMSQGWANESQGGSLDVALLSTGTTKTLYTFHDPNPTDQNLPTNVFLLSEITDDEIYRSTSGSGVKAKVAKYDIDLLRQACADTSTIPNPNNSPGSSPILRELLEMSGVDYSIVREMANDGQSAGHQSGNALDVAGDFTALTKWAYAFAGLFADAMWVNPDTNQDSLYIWDGAIADPTVFPLGFETGMTTKMHLATSIGRLSKAFSNPFILAAMGVGAAQVDSGGNPVGQFDLGLFGNRYVYVNPDRLLAAKTIPGTKVYNDPNAQRVDFW